MRPNRVKHLLRAGKPAVGTWLSLGSITAARFLARSEGLWPVERRSEPSLVVAKATLPARPTMIVLPGQ